LLTITAARSYYHTSDLALASFLVTQGHTLLSTQKTRGQGEFFFEDSDALQADLLRWGNDSPAPCRSLMNAFRNLKSLVR